MIGCAKVETRASDLHVGLLAQEAFFDQSTIATRPIAGAHDFGSDHPALDTIKGILRMTTTIDYDKTYSESFWRTTSAVVDGKDFFAQFYENFISASPEVKEKFEDTDLFQQKKMLRDSLIHIGKFSVFQKADAFMQRLVERHGKDDLGIGPQLYDLWLSSLIDTVRKYDLQFDGNVEIAWRIRLAPGIEYMKLGSGL